MSRVRSVLVSLATVASVTAALVAPGAFLSPAHAGFVCDDVRASGSEPGIFDYNGPSASKVYDTRFEKGFQIPAQLLRNYVPQGLAVWKNWVSGEDMFLATAYNPSGGDSIIYGVIAGQGQYMGAVPIAEGHVGGIAVSGKWAFVQGEGTIRRYDLADLRSRFRNGNPGQYLALSGRTYLTDGADADFMASDGDFIYAGKFNKDDRDYMYRYAVNQTSGVLTRGSKTRVPKKTQGLAVLDDYFVFGTSYGRNNRSNIYVANRGYGSSDAGLEANAKCFAAPSMLEGMALWDKAGNNRVYAVYESGAYEYNKGLDDPDNPIDHAHYTTSNRLIDWFRNG